MTDLEARTKAILESSEYNVDKLDELSVAEKRMLEAMTEQEVKLFIYLFIQMLNRPERKLVKCVACAFY